jgi:hypothetical protein
VGQPDTLGLREESRRARRRMRIVWSLFCSKVVTTGEMLDVMIVLMCKPRIGPAVGDLVQEIRVSLVADATDRVLDCLGTA